MRCFSVLAILSLLIAARPAVADDVVTAREHYRRGTNAFNLGHYDEAIKEYEAAYQIKDDPALLFNIAQAYRLAGQNEAAIRVYKSFIHQVPESPQRPEVEQRIAELQQLIERERRAKEAPPEGTLTPHPLPAEGSTGARATPAATVTAHAPPPPPRPWYRDKTAMALAGVGVVGVGVGIGLVAKGALDLAHAPNAADLQVHDNLRSSGIAFEAGGYAALGVGAALLTVAIVKWAIGARHKNLTLGTTRGGSIAAGGSW